jgi:glycosyltransferase involved in cell wall biosynthesis
MKVLMVTREYPPYIVGGVGTHTYHLTKYLRKKGLEVRVVSFGNPRLSNEEVLFVKPNSSIISREPKSIVEDAKIPLDIARFTNIVKHLLESGEYDIIHVQEPYVGGLINYEYKITSIHDTSFGEIKSYLKYFEGRSLRRIFFYIALGYAMEYASIATSKIIINPSPDVAWEMIRVYKTPLDKIRVIPNGVEEPSSNEPDKDTARRILGIPDGYFIVFATAQHVARKRLDTLIKAAKVLRERHIKNFMILIGGRGPLTDYLRKIIVNAGVNDVVKLTGWIPDDKLPLYYRASDVFVVTSEYEAGPITMLEAGIRGIPLVVSDVPSGFMMIARSGVDCLKFKLGDHVDLAEKIISLIQDQELWRSLSQGARRFASRFKWDNIAEKTMAVYRRVLAS